MREIEFRGRRISVPETLTELSPGQYASYILLIDAWSAGVIDAPRFRVRLMSVLFGLGGLDYTMLLPVHVARVEEHLGLLDAFIPERPDGTVAPVYRTPANLLPEFGGYRGPGDWLEGVSFGDFVKCLMLLSGGGTDDDAVRACRGVARVLYRIPEDRDVPALLCFHAPALVSAVWEAIRAAPVEINGEKLDLGIIFRRVGPARADDRTGWTGVTFEVAASGIFGDVAGVERTDMWAVLLYLYRCKFEYMESLKRNPK